jgi:hypothetical protein
LLAAELVSNAVRHTKGPAALRLRWTKGVLRIGAWDADPEPPHFPCELKDITTEGGQRPHPRSLLRRPLGLAAVVQIRQPGQVRVVRADGGLNRRRAHRPRTHQMKPAIIALPSAVLTPRTIPNRAVRPSRCAVRPPRVLSLT